MYSHSVLKGNYTWKLVGILIPFNKVINFHVNDYLSEMNESIVKLKLEYTSAMCFTCATFLRLLCDFMLIEVLNLIRLSPFRKSS